ncbi:hypothetical protein IJ135_01055 [Candidatus Saccharibacteria bacterium]|nr:hypothetical protein [Candidatus Saccharibacteria bacterium]
MRIVCVYRDNEDYTRTVTDFIEDFRRQTGETIESMNPDENTQFCETYDIVEYPTILALGGDGSVRAMWRGRNMPLINDVSYYL